MPYEQDEEKFDFTVSKDTSKETNLDFDLMTDKAETKKKAPSSLKELVSQGIPFQIQQKEEKKVAVFKIQNNGVEETKEIVVSEQEVGDYMKQ